MLRLVFTVISFILLGGSSLQKPPVVILSKKIEMDKLVGVVKYEGPVRIEYSDYVIVTKKMIINTVSKDGVPNLSYIEFPEQANLVKSDQSEVMRLPKAMYVSETGVITSDGDIVIEKDNKFFSTTHIEINIGSSKGMTQLWQ